MRKYRVRSKKREVRRRDAVKGRFSSKISSCCGIFFFLVSCFLLLTSCFLFAPSFASATSPTQVCFNDQCLTVEIADTDETRVRGLQGRTTLPADHGMLFIFPTEDIFNFWMKDTLIPLDMIWISNDFKIVDYKTAVPPCVIELCPTYGLSAKARYVLEINAHLAQNYGLKVGDPVVIK